ncbi:response regulator transcription factor [Urechidicola croceus]|uniref:Two-component system response regulator n=1 Tax=Urechidicola croceus TaxID=1850246 RepID=A0A1D8PAD9_9FLAO|nr:response regulator transcription factor [Urechidicola croceus]AOW21549.1 two-component system response regulator [Urechidicola croceus]
MKKKYNILLVEDDTSLGYLLSEYLKMKNFNIVWEVDSTNALSLVNEEDFDLIILDVMMPQLDGFSLAKMIKEQFPQVPFIFLSARSLKIDVLKGFSLGAVDYLKKPIDEEELVVRINTLLDRLTKPMLSKVESSLVELGKYIFNSNNLQLIFDGEVIQLTQRESKLLQLLVENREQICSHKEILNSIWGKNDYFNKKSLNVFISRLRKYLSKDNNIKIENIHSQGFILKIL